MEAVSTQQGWQSYAQVGRPDFLNYLTRGDVTWEELWTFYRFNPGDPQATIRLMGFFHMFQSQEYEDEGCMLDRDGTIYQRLWEWASLAVDRPVDFPEEKLRESLAGLLSQGLITPLYYEAAFSVYLEASLERQVRAWKSDWASLERVGTAAPAIESRKLGLHLAALPRSPESSRAAHWDAALATIVGQHYAAWNQSYTLALGDDADEWLDEGCGG